MLFPAHFIIKRAVPHRRIENETSLSATVAPNVFPTCSTVATSFVQVVLQIGRERA